MSLAIAGDHIIFKVCLKCGFDSLKYANRHRHPCLRCPECESYTFVITCSECIFENSPECPLTPLLDRKYGIHKEYGDDEEPRGQPWRRKWEQEGEDNEKEECSYSAGFAEEQSCKLATSLFGKEKQQDNHAEQAALYEHTSKKYIRQEDAKTNDTKLEDTKQEDNNKNGLRDPRGDVCPHCRQELCQACEPGYMSIIVDMKEFSKTFAPEIRFCTLCEHGLCPGSELVVFLQCRDCGHIGCEVCKAKEDRLGEDWRVCCKCEKIAEGQTEDSLGPELNAPMCQEGADEDSAIVNRNEGRARVGIDGINSTMVDDIPHSTGGVDLGFPEWLVGGVESEASATRVHPMQQHKITRLGEQRSDAIG